MSANDAAEALDSRAQGYLLQIEHKTVVLPFRMGIFKKGLPDIQEALNREGREGWQFKQIILPSTEWGKSDSIVAILERPIE